MSVLRTRLNVLAHACGLPEGASRSLRTLLDVVECDPDAPTSVTDPVRGVEVHVADSLDGLLIGAVRSAGLVADLGAGAGFPGLVIAIALPQARVQLVDSVAKKCEFMRRAVAAAGLDNVEVVNARAEDWPAGVGLHDVVLARAVAPLGVLVEYAAPLLAPGGHLVAWKGARDPPEEADAHAAASAVGLLLVDVAAVPPRAGADHRHLHVYTKIAETPERFPRRPGIARKKPISASD